MSREFQVLGPAHLTALGLAALLAVALILRARAAPDPDDQPGTRWALGIAIALGELVFVLYPLVDGTFAATWALPLQLCDVAAILALPALVTLHPFLVELLYYWAFTGTLLASLTPDIRYGFPHVEFLGFFASHALLVAATAYVVLGLRRHPRPGSWLWVFLTVQAYGLTIAALNLALGSNYLYLCRKPLVASPFDLLGPWPVYVAATDGILLALLLLLALPFGVRPAAPAPPDGPSTPPPSRMHSPLS